MRVITRLNVGGPALQAMLLTDRLDRARFETLLVSGRPERREGSMLSLRPEPVRPVVVDHLRRSVSPLHDAMALATLVRLMRQMRPHVVHTHLAKAGMLGRVAARLTGVRVVVHTFHGNVLSGYFGSLASRTLLELERTLGRMSTRVIAISPQQLDELMRLRIAPDRLELVPLGLDLGPFLDAERGRLRTELEIAPGTPLVGVVGRLVAIKGVDLFLRAAARLASERGDIRFIVVGDGEERGRLERLSAALGLQERVRFLGWRADLPTIYADLDVVTLTSWSEGTPVSLIEALAASRPVVATAVGGVPDVLDGGRCGLLVPAGDVAALLRGIQRSLEDPGVSLALARAGREHVLARHGADALVSRIGSLYARLVGSMTSR